VLHRPDRCCRPSSDAQPGAGVGDVTVDRVDAERQLRGDLLIRESTGNQPENIHFTPRQFPGFTSRRPDARRRIRNGALVGAHPPSVRLSEQLPKGSRMQGVQLPEQVIHVEYRHAEPGLL
jgi:hypothetical protein